MTSRDLMYFGKYKDTSLKDVPREYFSWLFQQDGAIEKHKKLYEWFCHGDSAASAKEQENITVGEEILNNAPQSFKDWWTSAYGNRLRTNAEDLYLPYLRVARESWMAAEKFYKPFHPSSPPLKTSTTKREVERLDDNELDHEEEF